MKTYKIAIIGAGAVSNLHAAAIKAVENAELAAIMDVAEGPANSFVERHGGKAYLDLDTMMDTEKPDVVIVAAPTFTHADYVERLAQRGVAVICEKPIEMSLEKARELAGSAEKHNIVLMLGYVLRFFPAYALAKDMYQRGELGEVMMAHCFRSATIPARGGWIIDPKLGKGAIQDMHIHDVDFLEYMFGQAESVYCHANRDHTGCFAHAFSAFNFSGGVKGVAECAFVTQNSYPFTTFMRICGTKASLEFRYRAGVADTQAVDYAVFTIYKSDEAAQVVEFEAINPYARQLEYFLDCVENGKQPEIVPIVDCLRSIAMLEAVHKSAETGKIVEVEKVD